MKIKKERLQNGVTPLKPLKFQLLEVPFQQALEGFAVARREIRALYRLIVMHTVPVHQEYCPRSLGQFPGCAKDRLLTEYVAVKVYSHQPSAGSALNGNRWLPDPVQKAEEPRMFFLLRFSWHNLLSAFMNKEDGIPPSLLMLTWNTSPTAP